MISLKSLLTENILNEDIKKDIDKFIDKLNKQFPDQEYTISSGGGKYVRINHKNRKFGGGESAWGFIAVVDNPAKGFKKGDLLKAAGYNTPAKHARGNILNGDAKYDKYSPTYLKEEEVNEGLYFVGYNKGRGQGTGVFKDSYSSYKDAKKAVEKLEKERGGSYNMVAYYVADKDGKFVRESVNEDISKKDIEKLTSYKDLSKFIKANKSKINSKNFNYIEDEVEALKYLESDYKRGKADRQEVEVAVIDAQDSIKRGMGIKVESVNEAKAPYEVYHKSYTSAIEAAREYAEKKGFEIDNDDSFRKIGMGPRKPSEGKTNSFSIQLTKDGKLQRKQLHIQVYGMKNSYELNAYIG